MNNVVIARCNFKQRINCYYFVNFNPIYNITLMLFRCRVFIKISSKKTVQTSDTNKLQFFTGLIRFVAQRLEALPQFGKGRFEAGRVMFSMYFLLLSKTSK